MLKNSLLILLSLLIALQSLAVVADEIKQHDLEQKIITFDHGLDFSQLNPQEEPSHDKLVFDNFHHCCHCHESIQHFTLYSNKSIQMAQLCGDFEYYCQYPSIFIPPTLRPPIV